MPALRWCMTVGHMPKLAIPTRSTLNPAPISQRQRLALIRKALSDENIPDRDRVIALLVLQTPAPVVARMLGYDGDTATRLASAAGSPWSRYAPGDHEQ
ncbi:hypothetical protein [Nonomuraea angiospora]